MVTDLGTAVVTGAASGIGEALARHAASLGMHVALADVDAAGLEALRGELEASGTRVVAATVDVSSYDQVESFSLQVARELGNVTLLFNNAGIETTGLLWELDPTRWAKAMDINVGGVFNGVRAFVPQMIDAGQAARVVNIASVGGLGVSPLQAPYIASKHAVLSLTECLDQEFQMAAPHLSASAVLPGPVQTAIFAGTAVGAASGEVHREEMVQYLAAAGMTPADVARIVFEGVDSDQLWIHTHPEMSDGMIKQRAEVLLSRVAPTLAPVGGEEL